jgi:hypothetical protein
MISKDCNFSEFMGAVRDKDFFEVIRLADLEATAAERLLLRVRTDETRKSLCGKDYARRIKQFIDYMRFEVKPRRELGCDAELFAAFDLKRGRAGGFERTVCRKRRAAVETKF